MSTIYDDWNAFISTCPHFSAGTDAFEGGDTYFNPEVGPIIPMPLTYNNPLVGLATPPRERINATIPSFDPDYLLFAFPFSQPEDSFVSPVNVLLPRPPVYDKDAAYHEDDLVEDMNATYPEVAQREFISGNPATMLATPPATSQRRRTDKPVRSNRFEPYNLRYRSPGKSSRDNDSYQRTPPTSPSPSHRSKTRSQKPSISYDVPKTNIVAEITASTPSLPSSSTSTTVNPTPVPVPCPRSCFKEEFSHEAVREIAQKYGLPPDRIFYYRRSFKRDSSLRRCPLDCGHYTRGIVMKRHLERYHPGIEGTTVTCSVGSRLRVRCSGKPVEGATYLEHFKKDHCVTQALCPFCLTITQMLRLKNHFGVCRAVLHPGEELRPTFGIGAQALLSPGFPIQKCMTNVELKNPLSFSHRFTTQLNLEDKSRAGHYLADSGPALISI
ncbi:hypothetical protein DFS33DRAFT_1456421 [Desarmillaria ectypa]|nr:hypothetical protein DFS33DRAFT_1456421 [Desarmillaria ectypa]